MTKHSDRSESIIFGFDSAWTNKPNAPGAICSVSFDKTGRPSWHEPRLASFEEAQEYILSEIPNFNYFLLALDQPTIVPNATGSGAPGRMFDASLERLSVTETSYNNSLAARASRSTIKTLPATLPEPSSVGRGPGSTR